MASINDTEISCGEFHKGPDEKVVIKTGVRRGEPFVDIRTLWKPDDSDNFVYTKKGVRFHAESLPDIISFLQRADKELDKIYDNKKRPVNG